MVAPGYGAICGPCPDGYLGDGEKCTGNYNVKLLFDSSRYDATPTFSTVVILPCKHNM